MGAARRAHQFHTAKFKALADKGVTLQNIVYYRSTGAFSEWATHYFVMTAQAQPPPVGKLIRWKTMIQVSKAPRAAMRRRDPCHLLPARVFPFPIHRPTPRRR